MPTIYKPKRKRDNSQGKRKERQDIYNTKRWKDLRLSHLMHHPLCQVCELEQNVKLGEHIHHLISFVEYEGNYRKQVAYDPNNLITVCIECHNRIHNGDLRGCISLEDIENKINLYKKQKQDNGKV